MIAPPGHEVLAAWGWQHGVEVAPLTGGLINATFAVRRDGRPEAVLQRLHAVFAPEVNLDIDAITAHLAGHGLTTPRLVRTVDDRAWKTDVDGRSWRALTWVEGVTVQAVHGPDVARAGGELVGRFHRALADLDHTYAFARAGVHDTAAHLARLGERLAVATGDGRAIFTIEPEVLAEAVDLGRAIMATVTVLPPMPALPRRHAHGDLKISNLLFASVAPARGAALVDLDTLGLQTLAFELGDAMRSWCNPRGEDAGAVGFDLAIFAAAIGAWRDVVGDRVDPRERAAIVTGLETVCVELAARFATDVFDDRYFGWDPVRFPSRRAHNLVRARGQLALAAAVRAVRADALAIVTAAG